MGSTATTAGADPSWNGAPASGGTGVNSGAGPGAASLRHEPRERGRGEAPAHGGGEDRTPTVEGPRLVEGLGGRMDVEGLALTTSCPPSSVVSSAHEKGSPKVMKKSPYSSLSSSGSKSESWKS